MIWDTLFALDADNKPQPQMVDTWSVSDDKLTYTFTLARRPQVARRPAGDGGRLRRIAARWGAKDGMGQALMSYTASLEAVGRQDLQAGAEAADRLRDRRAGQDRQQRAVHDAGAHRQDRSEHRDHRDDRLGPVPLHRGGMGAGQQGRLREVRRLCAAQGAGEPGGRRQGRLRRSRRVDLHPGSRRRHGGARQRRARPARVARDRPAGDGREPSGRRDHPERQARLAAVHVAQSPASAVRQQGGAAGGAVGHQAAGLPGRHGGRRQALPGVRGDLRLRPAERVQGRHRAAARRRSRRRRRACCRRRARSARASR